MAIIDAQSILAGVEQTFEGEFHSPEVSYPRGRHVKGPAGSIYVALQAVTGSFDSNEQIPLTDTDHWRLIVDIESAAVNADTVLAAADVTDGSILIGDAGEGEFTTFELGLNSNYFIDPTGVPTSRPSTSVPGDTVGFSRFPTNSSFNKLGYTSFTRNTDLGTRVSTPNAGNTKLDLAIDMQGRLISAYGQPSTALALLENSNYQRLTCAANFADCIANRNATVTQLSSFQGTYFILLSNNNFYCRTVARAATVQQMYNNEWLGQNALDFTAAPFSGDLTGVLGFEVAANYVVLLWIQTGGTYNISVFRMVNNGTMEHRRTYNIGSTRPTQFGFLNYPTTSDDTDPTDTTTEPSTFWQVGANTHHRHFDGSNDVSIVGVRLYPYRTTRFYTRETAASTHLHIVESDVRNTTATTLAVPNANTSFNKNDEHGLCFVYGTTIYVEGTNEDGELGTGDANDILTGETITIHSNTDTNFALKGAMFVDLGISRALLVWSNRQLWMCGLGRATRTQVGRFMHDFNGQVGSIEYTFQSNTFQLVFETEDTIDDVYAHNCSANAATGATLAIALANGLVYAKGNNLTDGNTVRAGDKRIYSTDKPENRNIDRFNTNYRRLSI